MIESVTLGNGTQMGHSVVNLVMNAGFTAKLDLFIVLLFSLGSWGIMLDKYLQFSRLNKSSAEFMRLFKRSRHLGDLADQLKSVTSKSPGQDFYRRLPAAPAKARTGSRGACFRSDQSGPVGHGNR